MFSFFRHPTTGIAFGRGSVRAARAALKGSSLSLLEHGEQAVLGESGGMPNAEQLALSVRSLQTTRHFSLKRLVVLLPAEHVYTQLCVIPTVAKKNLAAFVNDAVARTIPETFVQLKTVWKILQECTDHIEVGVAAIRQDVLQSYRSACMSAERQIIALTTAPCAIASTHVGPKPTSFLLASPSAGQMIATLFHHGWPVDEIILPAAVTIDVLVQTGESMAAEYREQGLVIEKMFLAGPWEGVSRTSTSTLNVDRKAAIGGTLLTLTLTPTQTLTPPHPQPLSLEPIFSDFRDRSWLSVACASVLNPTELAVDVVA